MHENNANIHYKYNRLELLLLGNTQEYFMEFQPYTQKGLYIIRGIDFILYNKTATEEQKIEFIDRIVNNRVQIYKPDNYDNGYFNNDGFYDYTLGNMDIVLFSFLSIKNGDEHTVLPFLNNDPCDGIEVFGYLENGDILGLRETEEYLNRQDIHELERIATLSYRSNTLLSIETRGFVAKYYGRQMDTIEDVKRRFKELAKLHHPDKGGNELLFKALSNVKTYLIERIRHQNLYR